MTLEVVKMAGLLAVTSTLALGLAVQAAPVGTVGGAVKGMSVDALADKSAVISAAEAGLPVRFEVFLPLRDPASLDALLEAQQDSRSDSFHKWLSPAEFAARFGPTAQTLARVRAALAGAGLEVSAVHSRSLAVSGSVGAVNRAFGVSLQRVVKADGTSRLVAPTELALPSALAAEGAVIIAFDGLPELHAPSQPVSLSPENRASEHGPYYFTDIRQAYDFPAYNVAGAGGHVLDGTGVNVAILMDGDPLQSDVAQMFEHEYWVEKSGKPIPTFQHVPIDGGPTTSGGLREASLDVQQVLGGAPGANVSVVEIPSLSLANLAAGYLDIDEANSYDIVNSSIVGCELFSTAAYNGGMEKTYGLKVLDDLFKQGNAQGITFVASSGDSGGLACPDTNYGTGKPSKFIPAVSFPADSPHVTAVGGGNLITTPPPSPQTTPPTLTSRYVSENADGDPEIPYSPTDGGEKVSGGYWGAGGGVSAIFARPSYQARVNTGSTTRRTVPDIGMQVGGCPADKAQTPCGPDRSSVFVYVDGSASGEIGTSVSSPEFVGAAALYLQLHGRQGNLNPYLYVEAARQTEKGGLKLHTGQPGFDGEYSNTAPGGGYDYTFGNGSPRVRNLFRFFDVPVAGAPQTPSNP